MVEAPRFRQRYPDTKLLLAVTQLPAPLGTQPLLNHARQLSCERRQPLPQAHHPDQPEQGQQPGRPAQGAAVPRRSLNAQDPAQRTGSDLRV
jgi:hypothetical protein